MLIPADDPLAVAATAAVQSGDLAGLELLLRDHPDLATVRIGTDGPNGMARTLLHAATDWPGNFPNNRTVVRMLLEAHFRGAMEWSRDHVSKAVIVYAWNEYDEGGWIGPTLVEDEERLSAVRDALESAASSPSTTRPPASRPPVTSKSS